MTIVESTATVTVSVAPAVVVIPEPPAISNVLPSDIVWRRDKQNFGNAQGELLKGSLSKEIISNYFAPDSLIFKKEIMRQTELIKIYEKYVSQSLNKGLVSYKEIFAPISLEIWLRKFENYIN